MSLLNIPYPKTVWKYFDEISRIPRLSKNESKIRKYLVVFALSHNLEYKEDEVGNILIIKPASPGQENKKTIVLQSHMDMVGEKNSDHPHNWETDPIIPVISDGWVHSPGTTLGADDGIGIAAQMAILADNSLEIGRIECLFTVDEESGMTGAINLKPDFISGNILLNLDSEDEGILYIGCAGGMDTVGKIHYSTIIPDDESCAYELSVTGLRGGHSGDEIHIGYGNSVKIMNSLLLLLTKKYEISINRFDAGNLRNAIPREAFATITIKKKLAPNLEQTIKEYHLDIFRELHKLEPDLKADFHVVQMPDYIISPEDQRLLLLAIENCPHGVIGWSKDMKDLVETSTNLASVKFTSDGMITIVTTQRSSNDQAKVEAAAMVEKILKTAKADVKHSEGYPGWKPNLSSEILKITRNSYLRLFGEEPKVRAIHAGLECGLIFEKNRNIDMISFGPSIQGAHTPEERLSIDSTKKFWDLLVDVIRNIPEKS